MVQQKFAFSHQDPLKKLEEKIGQDTTTQKALQAIMDTTSSSQATQSRTMASPQWDNNPPVNFRKSMNLAVISVADFDANNTHHPFCLIILRFCVWVFYLNMFPSASLSSIFKINLLNFVGQGEKAFRKEIEEKQGK